MKQQAAPNYGTPIETIYPGAVAWLPNTTVYRDLDINDVLQELHFKLTGTLTLAGYTTNPTLHPNGLEDLIRRVSFVAAAKQSGTQAVNLCSVDAAYLRVKTAIANQTLPDRVNVGNANGAYNFETNFSKFFGGKRMEHGGLTYLDTRRLQSLRVNFDTRDVTALVSGGVAGTATLTNVQITISKTVRQGADFSSVSPYIRETSRSFDLTNLAGIDKDFLNMPISNRMIRQWFKFTAGTTLPGDPLDGICATNAKSEGAHIKTIVSGAGGNLQRFDDTYAHIQTKNRHRFHLENWFPGWAVLEYAPTGKIADMLDLRNIISAKNQLDITLNGAGNNTVTIYDEELVAK